MSSKRIKKEIVFFGVSANITYNFTDGILPNVSLPTHFIYKNVYLFLHIDYASSKQHQTKCIWIGSSSHLTV